MPSYSHYVNCVNKPQGHRKFEEGSIIQSDHFRTKTSIVDNSTIEPQGNGVGDQDQL